MGEYRLGDHSLITTQGRDDLAAVQKRYVDLGNALSDGFKDRFEAFGTADELFARYPRELETVILKTVSAVAEDVAREKIYHWDEAALRQKLEERAKAATASFDRVRDQYLSIILTAEERENLRNDSAQSRPSVIGGGFGVEGAVQGVAGATAANAAIGLVFGAANAAGRALAAGGDKRRKNELFQDPSTKVDLANVLRDLAIEGHRLVATIVNDERQEPRFDVVTDEASRRATALAANVATGRVPRDDTAAVLIDAIGLNPFLEEPWKLWIECLGDKDGSVVRASQKFGVPDLLQHKKVLLERKRIALQWSTPEECMGNGVLLEEAAIFYDLPFDDLRREISSRSITLDQQRRTFNGIVYDTLPAAEKAQGAAEDEARRTFAGVVHGSESDADQARDIQARTFDDQVYDTQEKAENARKGYLRKVSFFYWASVVLAPFPSALLTLRKGFTVKQRIIAVGWMIICSSYFVYAADLAGVVGLAIVGCVLFLVGLALREGEVQLRNRFARETPIERQKTADKPTGLANLHIGGKRLI